MRGSSQLVRSVMPHCVCAMRCDSVLNSFSTAWRKHWFLNGFVTSRCDLKAILADSAIAVYSQFPHFYTVVEAVHWVSLTVTARIEYE